MNKIKIIKSCFGCPSCGTDMNITKYVCRETGRMIAWYGDKAEEQEGFFPYWCPLPDEK